MTLNELIENFTPENLHTFLYVSGKGDLSALYTGGNPYYKGSSLIAHILVRRDNPALKKILSITGAFAEFLNFVPVDLNRSNCWGEPALLYAIYAIRDLETIQILLENGAKVNQKNRKYRDVTPLMEGRYRLDLVQLLLTHKANIHAQDRFGRTVLMRAVAEGNDNLVNLLLAHGAHVDIQDEPNHRALMSKTPAPILASQAPAHHVNSSNEFKESPVNSVLPPPPQNMSDFTTPKTKRKR